VSIKPSLLRPLPVHDLSGPYERDYKVAWLISVSGPKRWTAYDNLTLIDQEPICQGAIPSSSGIKPASECRHSSKFAFFGQAMVH
jgi:hypothetical protein